MTTEQFAAEAHEAVEALADWSGWMSFSESAATAPRTPGVYLFRLPATGEIVYVGMAGPRTGSGRAQGLRGRLSIYVRGRGAVSGLGEAALDRALGDEEWLEGQLASLRADGPKRAKIWAQEAITHLAPEVRWAESKGKAEALALEKKVEDLLGLHGLWNRAATKLRHAEVAAVEAAGAPTPTPDRVTDEVSGTLVTFALHRHTVDLDVLYREMYRHSVLVDGERVYNGQAKGTPAVKHLLDNLFGVPISQKSSPVGHAIRTECRDRLHTLGWATKGPGRSAKYVLHREL